MYICIYLTLHKICNFLHYILLVPLQLVEWNITNLDVLQQVIHVSDC